MRGVNMFDFKKGEIKRNLLGGLEVALFMPVARKRFGNSYEEALRSFVIPILLFPLTLLAVYFYPHEGLTNDSSHTIALLYSLRLTATWALFLIPVYWIVKEVDRKQHFYQFVVAMNWLSVPATLVFLPVAWMLFSGGHTLQEMYPIIVFLTVYTYSFMAFMATYVLRIPWELAGFVTMISMCVNDSTLDILHWVGAIL